MTKQRWSTSSAAASRSRGDIRRVGRPSPSSLPLAASLALRASTAAKSGAKSRDVYAPVPSPLLRVAVYLGAQDETDAVQLQQAVGRLGERGAGLFEPYGMG